MCLLVILCPLRGSTATCREVIPNEVISDQQYTKVFYASLQGSFQTVRQTVQAVSVKSTYV